jgi:hypothetical protein
MKVLVACEESGTVKLAFLNAGIDAWSCDIQPSDVPFQHIQADVKTLDLTQYELLICHPPCTYLCVSGARWRERPERFPELVEASLFAKWLWEAPVPRICLENPKGHLSNVLGPATQTIHPWMFGHPEKKETMLWLKNLPPLRETDNVRAHMLTLPKQQQNKMHLMSPSKERSKLRSRTYTGIAKAMAEQWGALCR